MAAEMLRPSPKGKWKKALDSSSWWLLFLALFASNVVRDELGFWGSTGAVVVIMGLGSLLLARMAAPERQERRARDADKGIIKCAIIYADAAPGSLRGRWLPGFAELSNGTVRFRPDINGTGQPYGKIREFSDVAALGRVDPPAKRPAELKRGWRIQALGTDEGELHVATGDAGLKLIEERLG